MITNLGKWWQVGAPVECWLSIYTVGMNLKWFPWPVTCIQKLYVRIARFGWIYILKTPSQTTMQFRFKSLSVFRFVYRNRMHLLSAIVKLHKIHTLTIFVQYVCYKTVGYSTPRGYANSRTGRLADWTSRGLDNSRTRQVPDWTTRMPPATLRA